MPETTAMPQPAFLEQLNDSQRKAVEYINGPQLVIAGAGSGKTRVLTYKIAYLLASGMKPWEIMALTFTNKAAREMKARIGQLVGENTARYLRMGTFHSLFSRILRSEASALGYTSNFTIYDEADSRSLIKQIVKDLKLNDKVYKPAEVHYRISAAKNRLMTARDYAYDGATIARDGKDHLPDISKIYNMYETRCKASNAMDFDDLLLNTFLLFENNEEVLKKYCDNTRYILVDEYQDTNYAQQRIIGQLTSFHEYVCVVGDDAQSIYAFRGADINNILGFQSKYPSTRLFKLEQNYRSTQRIVGAANSLIKKNQHQIEKNVYSKNEQGDKITVKQLPSDREEAVYVCNDIKVRLRSKDAEDYNDFAILYRTNSQSRTFEEQFIKTGVPYRIYGGISFYQRKEIKDIIAYIRLVVNQHDDEALRRVINYPSRGIGDTTMAKVQQAAHEHGMSLWQAITQPQQCELNVNRGTMAKLTAFCVMIEGFVSRLDKENAYDLTHDIVTQTGMSKDIYSGKEPEDRSRQEHLTEFMSSVQAFTASAEEQGEPAQLADFLHDVALLTDRDQAEDGTPRITLMTVHSAKGLEFQTVYVVGMEEDIFPNQLCLDSPRALEEERRLLYVAITRAEKHCILTCAKMRFRYGNVVFGTPSRFIRDIDPTYITTSEPLRGISRPSNPFAYRSPETTAYDSKPSYAPRQPATKPVSPRFNTRSGDSLGDKIKKALEEEPADSAKAPFHVGDNVMHNRFGQGIVLEAIDKGDNAKVRVEFEQAGIKLLLLKFARLKKINP